MARILSGIVLLGLYMAYIVVVGLIVSYPMMLLWNGCLVPAVHGVQEVGWLQTWGIIILFGTLFRSSSSSSS